MGQGWREWLVQRNADWQPEIREAQIEQYFHPEREIFPQTEERPESLTEQTLNKWRSMKNYYPEKIELPLSMQGQDPRTFNFPYRIPDEHLTFGQKNQDRLPAFGIGPRGPMMYPDEADTGRSLGLGQSIRSVGMDKQNKPFLSIYDLWDFAGRDPITQFMMKGGSPYNVYDRTPIDLEDGKFPQYVYPNRRGDIHLPSPGIGPSRAPR